MSKRNIRIDRSKVLNVKCDHSQILKEIKESEERYRSLVEMSPELIAVYSEGTISYINNIGLDMVGAKCKDDVIGKPIVDFIDPEEREIVLEKLKHLDENRQKPTEYRLVRVDGKVISVEVMGVPITYLGKSSIQLVITDITNRKINEELLLKSEKLNVVGQLAAGVAHELRNPLTSLKGFLHLLRTNIGNPSESKKYMDIMSMEFDRIQQIINEFLVISKPSVVKFEIQNVRFLIEEVISLLETEANLNNVQIDTSIHPNIPSIRCDANQMKQVFINVIKNAIEAMPNGGSVSVNIRPEDDHHISISIMDEGMGIEKERIDRLGEPFYSTKEKGTGLGLMVCQQIIHSHRGKIIFNSKPEKGTTVMITLPVR